jgi:Ca-activated chloride channel family protein
MFNYLKSFLKIEDFEFGIYLAFGIWFLAFPLGLLNGDVGSSMRRGNALYKKGSYEEACKKYQEALVLEPDNTDIHYNIGRALYKMNKLPEAVGEFQLALLTRDKRSQANAFYNIGNCKFKQQQLDAAISSYTTTLILDPRDVKAKQNLEFCLQLKDQMKNQPQSDSTRRNQPPPQQNPQGQAQNQPQPGQIGKDEANRIIQAMQNREKENMKNRKEPIEKEHAEKDW